MERGIENEIGLEYYSDEEEEMEQVGLNQEATTVITLTLLQGQMRLPDPGQSWVGWTLVPLHRTVGFGRLLWRRERSLYPCGRTVNVSW